MIDLLREKNIRKITSFEISSNTGLSIKSVENALYKSSVRNYSKVEKYIMSKPILEDYRNIKEKNKNVTDLLNMGFSYWEDVRISQT